MAGGGGGGGGNSETASHIHIYTDEVTKKVQVGNDQEMKQSVRKSHSKYRGGEN